MTTKSMKLYSLSVKEWEKSQQLGIDSCDLAILHARQQIDLCKKIVRQESIERAIKINQMKEVDRVYANYIKKLKS
jgi:hypothetical protein